MKGKIKSTANGWIVEYQIPPVRAIYTLPLKLDYNILPVNGMEIEFEEYCEFKGMGTNTDPMTYAKITKIATSKTTKEIPLYACDRCQITSETPKRMCPCPRGSCEAEIAGKVIITKEIIES